MEILYSHRTRSADGQYVHISALVRALLAQGHGLTLCGPDGTRQGTAALDRPLDAATGENRGLAQLLPKPAYELAEWGYSLRAYQRLARAAQAHPPEIIYERYNLFFMAGMWLKKKLSIPLILEVNAPLKEERVEHGGLALKSLADSTERRIWQAADAVLPVTQVLADNLMAKGVPASKIHVIPNGIEQHLLEEVDARPVRQKYGLQNKTILGFTGFVRDWHGVDLILGYMKLRQNKSLHLLLVGDGPHVPALQELAQRHGLQDQFTVTGVVQPEEIPAHVAAFDIALQPRATAYASPLKLFEYMALGKAVIAPEQPNICEILQDGENARLFTPEDAQSLTSALDALCQDENLRKQIGAAAKQSIIDRDMTWAGNARKVCKIAQGLTA